jgi:hypothetical protein
MGTAYLGEKDRRIVLSRRGDDRCDLDHDLVRLMEENARLRTLVTQLSTLVLKHVAEEK